jgi:hypothetical protein
MGIASRCLYRTLLTDLNNSVRRKCAYEEEGVLITFNFRSHGRFLGLKIFEISETVNRHMSASIHVRNHANLAAVHVIPLTRLRFISFCAPSSLVNVSAV